MNVRKIAIIGGMGVAALCLVGAGAGATFTDSTHSVQTIQAGTMNVQLSAPSGTQSADKKTVTLPNASPVGSTFKTDAVQFEILNAGDIPVNEVLVHGTDTNDNSAAAQALYAQTNVCIYSPYIDSNNPGGTVFDGKLSSFDANGQQIYGPLAPNAKDHYTAEYYAGNVKTACGDETSSASLTNAAQGGSITPQVTLDYQG